MQLMLSIGLLKHTLLSLMTYLQDLSLQKNHMHYFFTFHCSIRPVTSTILFRGPLAINSSHHYCPYIFPPPPPLLSIELFFLLQFSYVSLYLIFTDFIYLWAFL
jgi:hypothetical protein